MIFIHGSRSYVEQFDEKTEGLKSHGSIPLNSARFLK